MPTWTWAVIGPFLGLTYLFTGVFFGTKVTYLLNTDRVCGRPAHDHQALGVINGVFWVIAMPVFTAWYLARFTPSLRIFKED